MNLMNLVGIAGFTITLVLTMYFWMDRWKAVSAGTEGFASQGTIPQSEINRLLASSEAAPTDDDALKAHQTLLRYISNDFNKGVKFVLDFGDRFFGDHMPLRPDLDTRKLMDNYVNPLQRP